MCVSPHRALTLPYFPLALPLGSGFGIGEVGVLRAGPVFTKILQFRDPFSRCGQSAPALRDQVVTMVKIGQVISPDFDETRRKGPSVKNVPRWSLCARKGIYASPSMPRSNAQNQEQAERYHNHQPKGNGSHHNHR
jgi:hypothetical protein